jgi:hypothetical protein
MKRTSTILVTFLFIASTFGQPPQKMSYQAVIRNTSNQLVASHAVGMKISILQGSPNGTPVYIETQLPSTNANGLVSIEIGGGTPVSGNFIAIDWSIGPYYIKTETDPLGSTNYTITGISQFLSVPYALYAAKTSLKASASGDTLYSGSGNYVIIPGISAANFTNFVFTKTISGYDQIFTANIDFTNIKQLTSGNINYYCPRISPDGKKVAYVSYSGSYYEIWVMNIDGTNKNKITSTGYYSTDPSWHNNGKEIIYNFYNDPPTGYTEQIIKIIKADGTNNRVLFNNVDDKDMQPCMNMVDSNFVAYYYDSGNWAYNSSVRIRNISAGTDETLVANNGWAKHYPRYSHNGQNIIWVELENGTHSSLKTINVSTKTVTTIETTTGYLNGDYSTDDQYIYHLRRATTGTTEIVKRKADGSNPVVIYTADNINWLEIK